MGLDEIDNELAALYDRLDYDGNPDEYKRCTEAIDKLLQEKDRILNSNRADRKQAADERKQIADAKNDKLKIIGGIVLGVGSLAVGYAVAKETKRDEYDKPPTRSNAATLARVAMSFKPNLP